MQTNAPDIHECLAQLHEIRSWISRTQIYLRGLDGANMDCSTQCLERADQTILGLITKLELHDCDTHSSIIY